MSPGEPAGGAVPGGAEILAGIREVAAEHLDWRGELPLEARLVDDLELDSIRLLTLAVEVENRFQVALEPADEQGIVTVADLVEAVARRRAARVPGAPGCGE
ncbi:MAG TPA: acyl carrier protein [Thermoanaerobaculia bacterium]|nr:acyl carrier protein [Thermoanaerobaculia bacterium]